MIYITSISVADKQYNIAFMFETNKRRYCLEQTSHIIIRDLDGSQVVNAVVYLAALQHLKRNLRKIITATPF